MIYTKKSPKQARGFSLVELMVAMVVGLIIVTGVFSLHTITRKTQKSNEVQMDMAADARFAIEMISYDLRHAGMWGGTNRSRQIRCSTVSDMVCTDAADVPAAPTNDCAAGWAYNLDRSVSGVEGDAGVNPYSATCILDDEKYVDGTDILEVKYADSNYRNAATGIAKPLLPGQVYIRSNASVGQLFIGTTPPVVEGGDDLAKNYVLNAYAYYISSFTDSDGDGIPSLRRASLTNGPAMTNQMLIAGVADMQVQFGEDTDKVKDVNGNVAIDQYVDADAITNPANVFAVKIWLLMRSDEKQYGVDTSKTFSIAGKAPVTYGGVDDYRYFLVSSVINIRNAKL